MEHGLNKHNPFSFKKEKLSFLELKYGSIKRLLVKQFRWPCFPRGLPGHVKPGAAGRVVAVTAVAIATGWKLEKDKCRSLKSRQGCQDSCHSGAIDFKSP